MHTYGHPVDLDPLAEVCEDFKLVLIEDAAESLGSFYKGRHTGQRGQLSALSFNGNKTITSGGGGAILTNDEELARHAKHLTTTAKVPHRWAFNHDMVGYNYRMPNINAALACAQLEQLDTFLSEKRTIANAYAAFFKTKGIHFRTELPDTKANYWLMCVELENKKDREAFLQHTNNQGVMTRPIWQLMFRLPMFKDFQKDNQKNAIFLEERIVNIPSSVR